ncbi:DMT family transporter [Algirhabdus cladophorae]|uniref:DMT family transporter n=1 Tax=Algirhabdus cladophorae TaxID=3377108 RepID=UPI003B847E74
MGVVPFTALWLSRGGGLKPAAILILPLAPIAGTACVMTPKSQIDAFGAASLICFSVLLAFNQVAIKLASEGLQPVFMAGVRSVGAIACIGFWMWLRGITLDFQTARWAGIAVGCAFGIEFMFLFTALDLTTVARASVIFYSMPLWLALAAHFLLGEHLHLRKSIGLIAAFAGVALAIFNGVSASGSGNLAGDICALLAAWLWAAIALLAKASPLRDVKPEMQLMWQVSISAPLLLGASLFFGPAIRALEPIHLWSLAFQTLCVASAGFLFWFWLLRRYPASQVASFSFLSPVFGVAMGWLLLNDPVGPILLISLVLVAFGLVLINLPKPLST